MDDYCDVQTLKQKKQILCCVIQCNAKQCTRNYLMLEYNAVTHRSKILYDIEGLSLYTSGS